MFLIQNCSVVMQSVLNFESTVDMAMQKDTIFYTVDDCICVCIKFTPTGLMSFFISTECQHRPLKVHVAYIFVTNCTERSLELSAPTVSFVTLGHKRSDCYTLLSSFLK